MLRQGGLNTFNLAGVMKIYVVLTFHSDVEMENKGSTET